MNALVARPVQHNTLNVYRTLPPNCIAFVVNDHYSLPFIRPGECVVVDTEDKTARVGDIYVIEWSGGRRNLCQARHSSVVYQREGHAPRWNVGSMRTTTREEFEAWLAEPKKRGAIPEWNRAWTEGPFTIEHLESKLVGAVIGLYQPGARGMTRFSARPVDNGESGEKP